VKLVASLPPGEGGFHTTTSHHQPYAKVIATPDNDDWTVDASHEIVEMLVDPAGNRLQTSKSIELVEGQIKDGPGTFEYLVEACDPCEADNFAYEIDSVAVSDFITPHFYDPTAIAGTRYSFTGAIKAPRQILPGGYISWVDPTSNEVQQLLFVDPNAPPEIRNLGPATGLSLREFVEVKTHALVRTKRVTPPDHVRKARLALRERREATAKLRAELYT
jgi:hypothetical protein